MYRTNPTHTGVVGLDAAVPPQPHLRWRFDGINFGIHDASKGSPTADATNLYVGADTGRFYAFDKRTGNRRWQWPCHPCRNGIHSTPAVDDKHVYVSDYGGFLTALDKNTGLSVWEAHLGDFIGSSPVLAGSLAFVGVEIARPDGYLAAVDRDTGELAFQAPNMGGHAHTTPTVDLASGRVFMGANSGRFYCFDAGDGHTIWEYPASLRAGGGNGKMQEIHQGGQIPSPGTELRTRQIKCSAAVSGRSVLFTSWDAYLHCLDTGDGHEFWRFWLGDRSQSSPAVDTRAGRVYAGSDDGNVYAVDLATGREIWQFTTGGSVLSSPVVAPVLGQSSKVVLIGSTDRFLYMLDCANGDPRWKYRARGQITGVPLADDHRIYISTDGGELLCFE